MRLAKKEFWADTADRVVATAAQSALAVVAVDGLAPNAFELNWTTVGGVALGGAALALLKALSVSQTTVRPASGGDVE